MNRPFALPNRSPETVFEQKIAQGWLPRGWIDGLNVANDVSDATNDLVIAPGICRSTANTRYQVSGAASTRIADQRDLEISESQIKQLDVAWAPGSGGLRSGSSIANGTWHIFVIGGTGLKDQIWAHDSVTASSIMAALPSGYTAYRRIGSILRESAAIVAFKQSGDRFDRITPVRDVNYLQNPGTSASNRTLSVPIGIVVEANLTLGIRYDGSSQAVYARVFAMDETDGQIGGNATNQAGGLYEDVSSHGGTSMSNFAHKRVRTNASAQVKTKVGFISSNDVYLLLRTNGWFDKRDRDG